MTLKKSFAGFNLDEPDIMLFGRETIYLNDQRVGWLSSAGHGYSVEKHIGYGCVRNTAGVDPGYLESGEYSLEIASRRYPCKLHLQPLYDPGMKQIKA